MKKFFLLCLLLSHIFADAKYLSPIPLPTTKMINLEIYPCNQECVEDYLQKEEYLSFLANINATNINHFQNESRNLALMLNLQIPFLTKSYKIILIAKKPMDRLFNESIKAITSLFFHQHIKNFSIKTLTLDPSISYQEAVNKAQKSSLIILLANYNDISNLHLHTITPIFIPTIHKNLISFDANNIYFGGIDYLSQIKNLLLVSGNQLSIFFLSSSSLSTYLKESTFKLDLEKMVQLYDVSTTQSSLKRSLKENRELNNSSVLLYTPPVTTALILSQLTYLDYKPVNKLSLQINYTPKLLEITQPLDRKNLILASSISQTPKLLKLYNELLGSDVNYNWVNYSILAGVSALLFPTQKLFPIPFIDNQLKFNIELMKCKKFSFEPLQKSLKNREEF